MLSEELELINSLTSTLASFKEDPGSVGGGVAKSRSSSSSGGGGREEHHHHHVPHTRDPDVWPPPTPVEAR